MLSLWSVRTVCVWITGRKDSCCLTVTSMCWEITDVFFYTDLTNPYAGYVLNLQKLKAYNRLMFPLAMALNREL